MQILLAIISMYHVHDTFNSSGSGALCTVKGEIPSSAATMAVVDTERATPENAQSCFGRLFGEKAFLKKEMMVKYEQYEFEIPLREIIPKLIS